MQLYNVEREKNQRLQHKPYYCLFTRFHSVSVVSDINDTYKMKQNCRELIGSSNFAFFLGLLSGCGQFMSMFRWMLTS